MGVSDCKSDVSEKVLPVGVSDGDDTVLDRVPAVGVRSGEDITFGKLPAGGDVSLICPTFSLLRCWEMAEPVTACWGWKVMSGARDEAAVPGEIRARNKVRGSGRCAARSPEQQGTRIHTLNATGLNTRTCNSYYYTHGVENHLLHLYLPTKPEVQIEAQGTRQRCMQA